MNLVEKETAIGAVNHRDDSALVSVVIPCYNHEKYIERCLNSVASQTYKNIEAVIIDDCSPDGSAKKIEQLIKTKNWQLRFPSSTQFHCFSQNQGAHAAINYGISKAKGDIIAILNSDDMYHPDRLKLIVNEMKQDGIDFVFSRVQYVDDTDKIVTESHPTAGVYSRFQKNIKTNQFPSVGFALLSANVAISTGNFAFTRALFNRVGEFGTHPYCHDWDFILRSLVHTEPFYLEQDLYYYRFHGKNTFESLGPTITHEELASLLVNFFSKVLYDWTPNPIAPSPLNWPGFFELFMDLWPHLNAGIKF
ncbi:MAG: glycosyltransferase family 2 protein [Microcoleus sp.]